MRLFPMNIRDALYVDVIVFIIVSMRFIVKSWRFM